MKTLTCGHEPSPHGEHTTGTATLPDGREVCWACADDWAREDIRTGGTYFAYLSSDGRQLTTWSGGRLADVTRLSKSRHFGFYGVSYDVVHFRAVDVHGARWYGTSPGRGMYARMRRAKVR